MFDRTLGLLGGPALDGEDEVVVAILADEFEINTNVDLAPKCERIAGVLDRRIGGLFTAGPFPSVRNGSE